MSTTRKVISVVLLYWITMALSHTLSAKISIGLVEPDFLLIVATVLAILHEPRAGALFGFISGAIDGGLIGADMASLVVTRTIAGYLAGHIGNLDFEIKPIYAALVVAGATIVCHTLFALPAPPPQVGVYVRDTIFAALYNGVLALPLYALVRRSLRRQVN